MARDVFHHLVRVLGPRSCRFQVLELGGPALAGISLEGRQTITGLAMFTGALTAICNPDRLALDYAKAHVARPFEPQASDDDATFAALHEVDLTGLAPIVVVPPNPAATADLVDHAGLAVQAGYLGSCASGRLEDLRAAAAVLKGRRIAPGFQLHIVPTSQAIMAEAAREGLLTTLIEAGAFVTSSSCDYCYGRIATMTAGQRAVSTGTLNVKGRMGSPGFRDLPLQRRGGGGIGTGGKDRRPASLSRGGRGGRPVSLATLRGRVAYVFRGGGLRRGPDRGGREHPPDGPRCARRLRHAPLRPRLRRAGAGGRCRRRRREFRLRPSPLRADDRPAPARGPRRDRRVLRHRLLAGGDRRRFSPDRLPRHHRPGRALGRGRDRLGSRASPATSAGAERSPSPPIRAPSAACCGPAG